MKLRAIYPLREDIPEAFRELFTEDKNGHWRLTEVEGIRTEEDVVAVQSALKNEREAHKRSKSLFADVEEVQDASAVRDLVMASVHTALRPLGLELEQTRKRWGETGAAVREFSADDSKRAVANAARAAAEKLGVLPEAMEDVLVLAERDLSLGDDGRVATKTGAPAEGWLGELQSKRPHWWPSSSGGGAAGGSWFRRELPNPWSAEHWNLTDQGRFAQMHGTVKAEEYAAKAGSRIGATEPPPRRR